ncbi:MAG: hypothetical protein ACJ78Q_08340 [Chloroflexia bacterium]
MDKTKSTPVLKEGHRKVAVFDAISITLQPHSDLATSQVEHTAELASGVDYCGGQSVPGNVEGKGLFQVDALARDLYQSGHVLLGEVHMKQIATFRNEKELRLSRAGEHDGCYREHPALCQPSKLYLIMCEAERSCTYPHFRLPLQTFPPVSSFYFSYAPPAGYQ